MFSKPWMTFPFSPVPSITVLLNIALHFLELGKKKCLTHTCGSHMHTAHKKTLVFVRISYIEMEAQKKYGLDSEFAMFPVQPRANNGF